MPVASEGGWRGPLISVLLHVLLIALLLAPAVVAERTLFDADEGGGGPGPAGGGGGGTGGTGGRAIEERIQYIDIAPNAIPALIPEVTTPLPEPVIVPPPDPVVPPPVPPPTPAPVVPEPKVDAPATPAPSAATSVIPGSGGGSGNDGTAGNGPGSGGGVGSGIGTGRGSGVGPGTGGGNGNIFPPVLTQVLLPPSDAPERIKPYTVVAFFEVDERGKVLKFEFNESKDRDYNKKVKAMLAQVKFRPATTLEGVPTRGTARIEFTVF